MCVCVSYDPFLCSICSLWLGKASWLVVNAYSMIKDRQSHVAPLNPPVSPSGKPGKAIDGAASNSVQSAEKGSKRGCVGQRAGLDLYLDIFFGV